MTPELVALHNQIAELRERVVKLELYVKIFGSLVTVVPTALQIWTMVHK